MHERDILQALAAIERMESVVFQARSTPADPHSQHRAHDVQRAIDVQRERLRQGLRLRAAGTAAHPQLR
jgi:hypothetical protein